jgi:hypothetical protein
MMNWLTTYHHYLAHKYLSYLERPTLSSIAANIREHEATKISLKKEKNVSFLTYVLCTEQALFEVYMTGDRLNTIIIRIKENERYYTWLDTRQGFDLMDLYSPITLPNLLVKELNQKSKKVC